MEPAQRSALSRYDSGFLASSVFSSHPGVAAEAWRVLRELPLDSQEYLHSHSESPNQEKFLGVSSGSLLDYAIRYRDGLESRLQDSSRDTAQNLVPNSPVFPRTGDSLQDAEDATERVRRELMPQPDVASPVSKSVRRGSMAWALGSADRAAHGVDPEIDSREDPEDSGTETDLYPVPDFPQNEEIEEIGAQPVRHVEHPPEISSPQEIQEIQEVDRYPVRETPATAPSPEIEIPKTPESEESRTDGNWTAIPPKVRPERVLPEPSPASLEEMVSPQVSSQAELEISPQPEMQSRVETSESSESSLPEPLPSLAELGEAGFLQNLARRIRGGEAFPGISDRTAADRVALACDLLVAHHDLLGCAVSVSLIEREESENVWLSPIAEMCRINALDSICLLLGEEAEPWVSVFGEEMGRHLHTVALRIGSDSVRGDENHLFRLHESAAELLDMLE